MKCQLSLVAMIFAASAVAATFPAPPQSGSASPKQGKETAVFAGGCFWGVEAVFEQLKGVSEVTAGYAGGASRAANYETVSSGRTGHAESVRVRYDPAQISYGELLEVFFAVAHNPTERNRQGPDRGTQYRSAIFYTGAKQKEAAAAYIRVLDDAHVFPGRIVTELTPLETFYPAEPYHQRFVEHHPDHPYVRINDLPKLDHLRHEFPELLRSKGGR